VNVHVYSNDNMAIHNETYTLQPNEGVEYSLIQKGDYIVRITVSNENGKTTSKFTVTHQMDSFTCNSKMSRTAIVDSGGTVTSTISTELACMETTVSGA
jgi:hypothetical protein